MITFSMRTPPRGSGPRLVSSKFDPATRAPALRRLFSAMACQSYGSGHSLSNSRRLSWLTTQITTLSCLPIGFNFIFLTCFLAGVGGGFFRHEHPPGARHASSSRLTAMLRIRYAFFIFQSISLSPLLFQQYITPHGCRQYDIALQSAGDHNEYKGIMIGVCSITVVP